MSKKSTSSWGGRRKLPRVFTEQGIYMLMTVLKGELATKQSKALIRTFCAEYPNISIKLFQSGGVFHDRYIILDYDTSDEKIFLCGGSSKDAGRKITSILEDPDRKKYDSMIKELLQNPLLKLKCSPNSNERQEKVKGET